MRFQIPVPQWKSRAVLDKPGVPLSALGLTKMLPTLITFGVSDSIMDTEHTEPYKHPPTLSPVQEPGEVLDHTHCDGDLEEQQPARVP